MVSKFRGLLIVGAFVLGAFAWAAPPQPLPGGGVYCDPPCTSMSCSGGWCQACNADGCLIFKDSAEETGQ